MKTFVLKFIFLSLLVNFLNEVKAQNEAKQEDVKYQISEVTQKANESSKIIAEVREKVAPFYSNQEEKETYNKYLDSLELKLQGITPEFIASLSLVNLESHHSLVSRLITNLKADQQNIAEKVNILEEESDKVQEEATYWENVLNYYEEEQQTAESLLERINLTQDDFEKLKNELLKLQDTTVAQLNKTHATLALAEEKNKLIENKKKELRSSILASDNAPFWKFGNIPRDSIGIIAQLKKSYKDDRETAWLYVEYNTDSFIKHFILIVILYFIFFLSKRTIRGILEKTGNVKLQQFLNHPFMVSFVFSFFFVGYLYEDLPLFFSGSFLILLFYPMTKLLNILLDKKYLFYLIGFILFYLISINIDQFDSNYLLGRMQLLAYQFLFILFLVLFQVNGLGKIKTHDRDAKSLVSLGTKLILSISTISFLLNVIGIVQLSHLLTYGTMNVIGIGFIYFLIYKITKILIIILLEWRIIRNLNIVIHHKDLVKNRLFLLTKIYFGIIYIRLILINYDLLTPFLNAWEEFVNRSWQLGEVAISIGDFLSFFIILIVSILLAKFIKYLFGTEILVRLPLKRGVPNAIATTFYYVILMIGFFLAAFSTGIEWSKVNLALGALGVGIGFGLQNVVFNFIAGLILIYERPVQVNDIVQVNDLMGSIKEIGIRSSKVLTYDGAEVVVPNGNLISNEVINWTLSNQNKRQELRFKSSYQADPKNVMEILRQETLGIENVIDDPAPLILFEGYGDGTLEFRVLFWTNLDVGLSTKSKVAMAIFEALQKAGFEIPTQRQTVIIEESNKKQKG